MLHTDGYCIHPNVFSTKSILNDMTKINNDTSSIANQVIFNNKRSGGDKKRLQTPISAINTKSSQAFTRTIQNFAKTYYPNHNPNSIVILTSLPGCDEQLAHCDYAPSTEFATVSDDMVPLGCIIALEPGTKLKIWPKSIRLSFMNNLIRSDFIESINGPIRPIEIELNPGDVLVFRGDLVHAGSAYNTKNNRIHLYLDSPLVSRPSNTTWFPSDSWIE